MKPTAYYYTAAELGLPALPPGFFHLDESIIPRVASPTEADLFVVPTDIMHLTDDHIRDLVYLNYHTARRHVFFSLGEAPTRPLPFAASEALAFRTDQNKRLVAANPNAQVWCWGVEDLKAYQYPPNGNFLLDVHAQLWASTPLTHQAVESCQRAGLHVHDQRNEFFYGTLETAGDKRLTELRRTFLDSMRVSKLVLVPRSRVGMNRYRFFEALSMGRVPVLLSDDALLPFANTIDWDRACIRIGEAQVHDLGNMLVDVIARDGNAGLASRGAYGRMVWEKCFAPNVWENIWAVEAELHLRGF